MEEICIKIPDEIAKELKFISDIDRSLLISNLIKDKMEKIAELKKIASKSKLSEEKANEIADRINESLAKKYEEIKDGNSDS